MQPDGLRIVTIGEFVSVEEPGAAALLGTDEGVLIPEGGDVMFYGDGGAGKTTLAVDLACHLSAGDTWLEIPVARCLNVLLIENEGPRPMFRKKLAKKRAAWRGGSLAGIHVLEAPWATLTVADETHRAALAESIAERAIDVVILGPVTRSGMNEAGTLQEVRDFMVLIGDVRRSAGRPVTFVLVHHENKGGQVSGAWEGAGDTLFHVQGQGHGRTRLYIQKARWSSVHHATSLQLVWSEGDGFEVEDKPVLDDETLADQIVEFITENAGTGWTAIERATPGVAKEKRRAVRDGLFAAGRIVNIGRERGEEVILDHCPERHTARLHLASDPTITHLRRNPGADGAQAAPATGADGRAASAPCAPPLRGAGVGADQIAPAEHLIEDEAEHLIEDEAERLIDLYPDLADEHAA